MSSIFSFNKLSLLSFKDLIFFSLLITLFYVLDYSADQIYEPILLEKPITLDLVNLPWYSLRTFIRMLIAIILSLLFTFVVGALAVKSPRFESIIIHILNILQSVPILGYLSIVITGFMALFPGNILGIELASIFAIFTSQVWNMTFSFYHSLKSIPKELNEAASIMQLSSVDKFFRLEVPFAIPSLLWNTMISMSGGWFFVVASEAITVGNTKYSLPGIGAYIALAIAEKNLSAVLYSLISMTAVILFYDQIIFKPLTIWAEKFKFNTGSIKSNFTSSYFIDFFSGTKAISFISQPIIYLFNSIIKFSYKFHRNKVYQVTIKSSFIKTFFELVLYISFAYFFFTNGYQAVLYIKDNILISEILLTLKLGTFTAIRVFVLIFLASLVWVPIGIYIGLRPNLTKIAQPLLQFLSAFPINLFFPVFVVLIMHYKLEPNIWLSPLMIIGTQWYILFNVISGASSFSGDLKEVSEVYSIKGYNWWSKVMLPGIFPNYVTGAITATGGAWNASIVAEFVTWGDTKLVADGIGSYITISTINGEYNKIALGITVLTMFVLLINRLIWEPLNKVALQNFGNE